VRKQSVSKERRSAIPFLLLFFSRLRDGSALALISINMSCRNLWFPVVVINVLKELGKTGGTK
jgi:hypothetical protein